MFELTQDKIIPFNLITHKNYSSGDTRDIIGDNVKYYFYKNCFNSKMEIFKSSYFQLDGSRLNDSEINGILSNDFHPFFQNRIELGKL